MKSASVPQESRLPSATLLDVLSDISDDFYYDNHLKIKLLYTYAIWKDEHEDKHISFSLSCRWGRICVIRITNYD